MICKMILFIIQKDYSNIILIMCTKLSRRVKRRKKILISVNNRYTSISTQLMTKWKFQLLEIYRDIKKCRTDKIAEAQLICFVNRKSTRKPHTSHYMTICNPLIIFSYSQYFRVFQCIAISRYYIFESQRIYDSFYFNGNNMERMP